MPKAILSDSDMAALEAQHEPSQGRVLSDDEMSRLEAHHSPGDLYKQEMNRVDNTDYGAAANNAISMMTGGGLAKSLGKDALGWAGNAAESAITGAAQDRENRGRGALVGGAVPIGLELASKLFGAGGRALIQKAAGVKNPTPETGQQLLDQGVWGTRGMMRDKVADKITKEGAGLTDAVGKIKGAVEVAPLAQQLDGRGAKLAIGGAVPPEVASKAGKYADAANYLGEQGAMTPTDLLKYKQLQGDQGHALSGSPLTSDAAEVSRSASRYAGNLLKEKYAQQFPGGPNAVADQNAKLAALFDAKRGLKKETSLIDYLKSAGTGLAGKTLFGPAGAAAGALAQSPIGQSAAAQALNLAGKGADKLNPDALRALLLAQPSKGADK